MNFVGLSPATSLFLGENASTGNPQSKNTPSDSHQLPLHRCDSKRKMPHELKSVTFDSIAEKVATDSSDEDFITLLSEIKDSKHEFREYERRCCIADAIQV
eukprot:scaffold47440_cov51-Attheya_sp.AAC.1